MIRCLKSSDHRDLYQILSNPAVMQYLEPPFNWEQTENFLQNAGMCHPPLVYGLVWKESTKLIGHVIFHPFAECGYELGWVLHPDFWGMGIATEVTEAVITFAKNQGIACLYLECSPQQIATIHIAKRFSFQYVDSPDGCFTFRLDL